MHFSYLKKIQNTLIHVMGDYQDVRQQELVKLQKELIVKASEKKRKATMNL